SANLDNGGRQSSVTVRAAAGCAWTASSNTSWITNVSPPNGTGAGSVAFAVQANDGPERTGTLTVAGQAFTVTQGGGCPATIAPATANFASPGAPGSSTVSAAAGCSWTASSNVPWITNVSPATGSGTGPVTFTVQTNTGPQRTGTL